MSASGLCIRLRVQHNRLATRERMIVQWLPLAFKGCRKFSKTGILMDDLRQEAVVGLIHAVDKYKPGRGNFQPYAARTITNQLRDMCGEQMRIYRVPAWLNKLACKVRKGNVAGVSDKHLRAVQFLDGQPIKPIFLDYTRDTP